MQSLPNRKQSECSGFKTNSFIIVELFAEGHNHYHINCLNTFISFIDFVAKRHTRLSANFFFSISSDHFCFVFFSFFFCLANVFDDVVNKTPISNVHRIVLDSSGNPESGFVLGHSFWLGSIKGCEAVQNPHTLTLSNRFERVMHANLQKARAPFDIGYRVVYAAHTSPWQIQVEFLLDAAVSWFDTHRRTHSVRPTI